MMEDRSYEIIKKYIPIEWVIREFNRPDYGIDLVVELFEKVDDEIAETLGEFIYLQVKSVKQAEIYREKVYGVGNVAKGVWMENRDSHINIDVVKYLYDTNSVFTIQSLGASVSVLLFLVDLEKELVYFICLNDYIDKILLPKKPKYIDKEFVTIKIPALNSLSNIDIANNALTFYGKRAKLLSAFSKFAYQKNEIAHVLGYKLYPVWTYRDEIEKEKTYTAEEIKTQLLYFISQIEDLDIWNHSAWMVLPEAKKDLMIIKSEITKEEINWEDTKGKIIVLWHQLTNLGTIYEDLCREWFLPKMISFLTSYPTSPEIIYEIE